MRRTPDHPNQAAAALHFTPLGRSEAGPVRPSGYTTDPLARRNPRRYTPTQEGAGLRLTFPARNGSITMNVEVSQFCAVEGLMEWVALATQLLQRHFSRLGPLEYVLEDGIEDEIPDYVALRALATGAAEDLARRYFAYQLDWANAAPLEAVRQIKLDLEYCLEPE